jgi:TonB family protein
VTPEEFASVHLPMICCRLRFSWGWLPVFCALAAAMMIQPAWAGQTAPAPPIPPAQDRSQQPASSPGSAAKPSPPAGTSGTHSEVSQGPAKGGSPHPDFDHGEITEEEIKQLVVGKPLYLRSGYLDDTLSFNEHGVLIGHSPAGSYTLSVVEIDKMRLTKHRLELIGARYGLHFLGALPYEDPTNAVDRVRVTPKKKVLKITIDRELVIKPKKEKEKPASHTKPSTAGPSLTASNPGATSGAATEADSAPEAPGEHTPDADQSTAQTAAQASDEQPADPGSVTKTTSPAHAANVLRDALKVVFAESLDEGMMASMPDFWRLYYEAAAAKTDFRPNDPAVLRQNMVDSKARLITNFEPSSNEYAQANGVAGMALYHAVIGADGKPTEIAVARPIGFGLDENAVAAIRQAKFEPASKDGKPVAVLVDLVVQFRIYSKRTSQNGTSSEASAKPVEPTLPGPYSIHQPTPPPAQ